MSVEGYQFNFTDGRTGKNNPPNDHNTTRDDAFQNWDERSPDRYIVAVNKNYKGLLYFSAVLQSVHIMSRAARVAVSRPLLLSAARGLIESLEFDYKTYESRAANIEQIKKRIEEA